jgi:beta-fructofuranosidase
MSFRLADSWVWDFWLADDGELFHMFYLHAPRSLGDPELRHRNARFGHATSEDLIHWTDLGPIVEPGKPGDFDETATWTGSVVRGPDGLWRMFYTGASFPSADSASNIETIGVATSPDLYEWTRQPGPLTRADDRWYETLGTSSWPEEAWRDPWVFADPRTGSWHMLITARSNAGPELDRGVVGHAVSEDLAEWKVMPPLSEAGAGFAHLEVLQVAEVEGRPVLLFSCDSPKLSPNRAGKRTGGIWAVPLGQGTPWHSPIPIKDAHLVAEESLYSGRIIADRQGRSVLLAFDTANASGEFLGSVSDPFLVRWDQGRIVLAPMPPSEEEGVLCEPLCAIP